MSQPTNPCMHISTRSTQRPTWVLAALALGMAPLVTFIFLDALLSQAQTWLAAVFSLGPQDGSTLHATRLALRMGVPTLLLLVLLYCTRLGGWLVVTRLALALLIVEDGFILIYLVNHVSLYVLTGNGFMRGVVGGPGEAIATGCMAASALLVATATARHRSKAFRGLLESARRRWLREV